jgi:DNA-binding transcriptional regulator YdaS (Cro superfamily)
VDKYAKAFVAAMKKSGIRNTVIAAELGVVDNCISQWRTGRRPIPADRAVPVASLLKVRPEQISEAYDRLLQAGFVPQNALGYTPARDTVPEGHVAIDRLDAFGAPPCPSRLYVPDILLRRKIGLTPPHQLRWALQPSRAMEPEIEREALVLIDATVAQHAQVIDGGIYAYSLWGRPDIRRLLVRENGLAVAAHGKEDEATELRGPALESFVVLGAVVAWL